MIYKDLITNQELKDLTDLITRLDFPWYFQPNIAYKLDDRAKVDPNSIQSFGLTHVVWDAEKGKVSEALSYVSPIIEKFTNLTDVKINNLLRIKINLQTQISGNSLVKYNGAHVDRYIPHRSLIFYPFDSDGDFVVFAEKFNEQDKETWPPLVSPTVKERFTPTANSLYYLEDGFVYHSSSNPMVSNLRYSINFNFN